MLRSTHLLIKNTSSKEEVIDSTLLSFEADIVKKITLSHMAQPDQLTWPFNPTGEYSVKARYKFLAARSPEPATWTVKR